MQQVQTGGGLQIRLPAKAANVSVVRHALAGLAETLGMDEMSIADLKTVVTEACMNVVVHAYDDEGGVLEVEASRDGDAMKVVVRDFGTGIRPDAGSADSESLRLGLSMIAALSRDFQISGGDGKGVEIGMWISLAGAADAPVEQAPADAAPEVHVTVAETDLLRPVLGRIVGALAARQDLTIDRLSDAMLLTDALSEGAPSGFSDRPVHISLLDGDGTIRLRVGPMDQGAADRLRSSLELDGVDGSLEKLANDFRSESDESGEYVVAHFATFKD